MAAKPIMSEDTPSTTSKVGILIGLAALLVAGTLMTSVASSVSSNRVALAIANHQSVVDATDELVASADISGLRSELMKQGLSPALATAHDLSDKHLTLEGGFRLKGDRQAGAFRYRDGDGDGDSVYILQTYSALEGGGTTKHSRYIGHNLMRGYTESGVAAAVWGDHGNIYVFSGDQDVEAILDLAASAFYGLEGGAAHH